MFSWSYSRLKNFETCPKRHYHYDVAKDTIDGDSEALQEGHRMHKAFQVRVAAGIKLPLGYVQYEPLISKLADAPGLNYAEQKLALDANFKPASWRGAAWFRAVIDFCKVREKSVIVVDYKSGKPQEDDTQLALQAATVLHHLDKIESVKSAFLFTAFDKLVSRDYTRDDLARIWANVLPRVQRLEAAQTNQEYPPKPSGLCIKYCGVTSCPYHGVGSR
jgi:hypothetical protein